MSKVKKITVGKEKTKQECIKNIFEIIQGHVNERLKVTEIVLEAINKDTFQNLIGRSVQDIKELKTDLDYVAKELIRLQSME